MIMIIVIINSDRLNVPRDAGMLVVVIYLFVQK